MDPKMVKAARAEEIKWVESADLFDPVPRSEATPKPITLKWVDTNKGDDVNPMCRSRLVLRDIKARRAKDEQLEAKDLFSSMPPLESFRTMVLLMMSKRVSSRGPVEAGVL